MAGLQVPLSTLRLAPRDALRMTRGQSGLLFLSCQRLSLFTLCRSPGALTYDFFRSSFANCCGGNATSWRLSMMKGIATVSYRRLTNKCVRHEGRKFPGEDRRALRRADCRSSKYGVSEHPNRFPSFVKK